MEEDLTHPSKRTKPTFDEANEVVRFVRELPPVYCTLQVESFSQLQKTHLVGTQRDHFDSIQFKAGGYNWVLIVYPNGSQKENGDGHLSIYVRLVDKLGFGTFISAALRFLVHDQIRDKYLTILDIREKRFQATKYEWGISKALPLSSFTDPSNGYLINDCCVFGAEVLVMNVENYASRVSTLEASCNWKYTWMIDNYSGLLNPSYSPKFVLEEWTWRLSLYPQGDGNAQGKSLSLFLELCNADRRLTKGSKLFVGFELHLKNQLGGSNHTLDTGSWFSPTQDNWGRRHFCPLEDVGVSSKGFVVDDAMIIKVEIKQMLLLKDMGKGDAASSMPDTTESNDH